MSTLSTADRSRLVKLLGLLASDHIGERDAAALAANRLVQSRNVTWSDVVEPPAIEKQLPEMGAWRQTVSRCLERQSFLRSWEAKFLRDLSAFQRISTKQRNVLQEIADRVLEDRRT